MQGFYTPAQLAEMLGGGESTYRMRAARGEFKHAVKQGNTWFISLLDVSQVGRGYDREFAEPQKLSPEYPNDSSDIVIAQNSDGRYGIYLSDHWYGASQALNMLDYLTKHRAWLEEKVQPTVQEQLVNFARQIAQYRGYTDLINGLQPEERLREKYTHEIGEFKEALASKSWLHQLHEASDVIYYAACTDAQSGSELYVDALRECMQLLHFHGVRVTSAQIEQAALAKYGYRASAANNKDEAQELSLIQEAVSK